MAHLQKQFVKFHEKIKLNRFDENATLREKRDIVLDALRDGLDRMFEDEDESRPTFDFFNQGSYAMGTGIEPLKGRDYDIDVGLRFHVDKEAYGPLDVKGWVHDALEDHTEDVELKRCCVTVNYAGEYHVDLAVYASSESNNGQDFLAKGFKGSSEDNKFWERSDAREFIELIDNHLPGDRGRQFRRSIRYLKRWKDYKFSPNGNGAPVGIGLTICAYHWFRSVFENRFTASEARDIYALEKLVQAMHSEFQWRYHEREDESGERLEASMPVAPRDDVFDRMSNRQMGVFKDKLDDLRSALSDAIEEADPHEAAKELQKQFGDDFPVPPQGDSAKKADRPAITTSSSSA